MLSNGTVHNCIDECLSQTRKNSSGLERLFVGYDTEREGKSQESLGLAGHCQEKRAGQTPVVTGCRPTRCLSQAGQPWDRRSCESGAVQASSFLAYSRIT